MKIRRFNESVRSLMKPKSDKDILKNFEGKTPYEKLLLGAENGILALVKNAIENGADMNKKDLKGETALICASLYGYLDIVRFLVENGADVNEKNTENQTALVYASKEGYLDIVKFLVENGTIVDIKDVNGWTALYTAQKFNKPEIVRYLKPLTKINESVRSFMKPKSDEDILKDFEGKTPKEKLFLGAENAEDVR